MVARGGTSDAPFPEEVLAAPADPQTFTGSIGFRESIVAQIRRTKPTVREYLKQTRYTGSGHAGFVGTPEQLAAAAPTPDVD